MDSKALQYVKKLGPLIGLILLLSLSLMNDSFLEFSNLRNLLPSIHQCDHRLWYDLRHLNGRYRLICRFHPALSSAVMANLIVTGTDPVLAIFLAAGAGLCIGRY